MRCSWAVIILALVAAGPAAVAVATDFEDIAGVWTGVVTGREMASAAHVLSDPARLTIDRTGRFTLVEGATTSKGNVTLRGDDLQLEGEVTAPGARAGERVYHRLRRHRDGLFGRVTNVFSGIRATAGAELRRANTG